MKRNLLLYPDPAAFFDEHPELVAALRQLAERESELVTTGFRNGGYRSHLKGLLAGLSQLHKNVAPLSKRQDPFEINLQDRLALGKVKIGLDL